MSSYFIHRICIQKGAGQVDLWVSGEPSTHLHPPSLPGSLSPIQMALLNFPAKSWKIDKNTPSHCIIGEVLAAPKLDWMPLHWDGWGFAHLLRFAVDGGQICTPLLAEVSAEAPRLLLRGNVIQAALEMEPSLLEIGICCDERHKYPC